jgi:hypothetical protein
MTEKFDATCRFLVRIQRYRREGSWLLLSRGLLGLGVFGNILSAAKSLRTSVIDVPCNCKNAAQRIRAEYTLYSEQSSTRNTLKSNDVDASCCVGNLTLKMIWYVSSLPEHYISHFVITFGLNPIKPGHLAVNLSNLYAISVYNWAGLVGIKYTRDWVWCVLNLSGG